ncbi:MAG TPA: ABC transporter substrate-binding protein [Spirochaetales bacterium]|nr:ABC transporter substrate-binding protein [Spirochaetales bacterium]HRY55064.1 ABC transporter substrate-binding protein [Spirochaetia bacterium]HRZ64221.1 ABC transporter substrate-binding protein [Spirochaetia bacterium]
MRRKAFALAALVLAATVAASAAGNAGKKTKDTLRVAIWEDLKTMDPQASNFVSYWMVQLNIFDKLVYEDSKGVVHPRLATEWKFLDDLTLEMKLRKDVVFHDSGKFTAEDVLFTFSRGKANPVSASTFAPFDLEKTVIVDPYTIRIKFKTPYAAVFNTLSTGRGAIVSKAAVERMGSDAFARSPVGSGPYKLERWKSGTEIALVRNDAYWGTKAITKNVVYSIIPEAANRVIELETGGVDAVFDVAANDVKRVKAMKGAHILMGNSSRYMTLTFSMKDKLLSDKNVRYALSYAIDKKALVDAVYEGTATTANGMYPPTVFAFKDKGVMPYDPVKAKELLAKAGYPDGFTMDFLVENREIDIRLAEIIQNMWAAVGVKVKMYQMNASTYTAQGHKFQAGMRAGNVNEPSNILIIYDSAFGERLEPNDPWIDKKLAAAKTIYDSKKRAGAYAEIQDYLYDARWTVPFAFTPVIYALSDKVEGFACDPMQQVEMSKVTVYQ